MTDAAFRLAHLSDPHLGPLPAASPRELAGKRLTGWWNWHKSRKRIHDMDVLAALVADIEAAGADEIALTGDVSNIGLPAEFETARALLERLGPPPRVSFVPGNHDAYVRASAAPLRAALGAWMVGDDARPATFPFVRRRGPIALVGLNSGVPTLPLLATGSLGRDQRQALETILAALGREGATRVVLVHHAPHRGGSRPFRQLMDARQFEAILARVGAELVLHGHNHRTSVAHRPGPAGPIPIVGVGSASAAGGTAEHRASWHLVTIEPGAAGARIGIVERARDPAGRFHAARALDLSAAPGRLEPRARSGISSLPTP